MLRVWWGVCHFVIPTPVRPRVVGFLLTVISVVGFGGTNDGLLGSSSHNLIWRMCPLSPVPGRGRGGRTGHDPHSAWCSPACCSTRPPPQAPRGSSKCSSCSSLTLTFKDNSCRQGGLVSQPRPTLRPIQLATPNASPRMGPPEADFGTRILCR